MAGKTKIQLLEEQLKKKEIDKLSEDEKVDKVRALTDLLATAIIDTDPVSREMRWSTPFNEKAIDIITNKVIEIVKGM